MKKKLKLIGLLAILTITLSNCATQSVDSYTPIKTTNKTISLIGDSSNKLASEIKKELRRNGWKIYNVLYSGDDLSQKSSKVRYNSSYAISGTCKQVDVSILNFEAMWNFHYEITDLKTGQEVAIVSGKRTTTSKAVKSVLEPFLN